MVVRVAERAALSQAKRVVVATDDHRIAEVCQAHGFAVAMTRSDHATGTDRLSEVATQLNLDDDAIVVNVQGDEPLIPPNAINAVAAHLSCAANAAIATLVHPIADAREAQSANVVKCVMNERGEALYFSRAPIPFDRDGWSDGIAEVHRDLPLMRHIGLYAYRAGFLREFPQLSVPAIERFEALEQLRALAHGFTIAVLRVDAPLPPGIDTPADYERVRRMYE